MTLPARIRDLREQRRQSQSALARDLGVQMQQVSRWELGTMTPSLRSLTKLAALAGKTPTEFAPEMFGAPSIEMERFSVGDGVEQRRNGQVERRGRVVAIVEENGAQILTIEWEKTTQPASSLHRVAPR